MNSQSKDCGWSWIVLAASMSSFAISSGTVFGCIGVYFVTFREYFQADNADVALITSLPGALLMFSGPLASFLYETIGSQWSVMLSGIVSCIALILVSFTHNIYQLALSFTLFGIGIGLNSTSVIAIQIQYFEKYQKFALSVVFIGGAVGLGFARMLVALIEIYTWRGAVQIVAGICLQLCVLGAIMKPRNIVSRPKFDNFLDLKLLKNHWLLLSCVCTICIYSSFLLYMNFIIAFMIENGLTEIHAATIISFAMIPNLFGRIASPFLVQHCKYSPLFLASSYAICFGFSGLSTVFCSGQWPFVASVSGFCLFYGLYVPLGAVILNELFGVEKLPKTIALTSIPISLGILGITRLVGHFVDLYGYFCAFYFVAFAGTTASLLYCSIGYCKKNSSRRTEENVEEL